MASRLGRLCLFNGLAGIAVLNKDNLTALPSIAFPGGSAAPFAYLDRDLPANIFGKREYWLVAMGRYCARCRVGKPAGGYHPEDGTEALSCQAVLAEAQTDALRPVIERRNCIAVPADMQRAAVALILRGPRHLGTIFTPADALDRVKNRLRGIHLRRRATLGEIRIHREQLALRTCSRARLSRTLPTRAASDLLAP